MTAEETIRRGRREVRLTKLDRVLWPESGITRRALFDYYAAVAPVLLPHVRNRPFTIRRHYTVPRGPYEWVKDAPPEAPDWLPRCPQPARSRGGAIVDYLLVNDELGLLWVLEYGAVDLHVWSSRCDRPERPDYVLFDVDPESGAGFDAAVATAQVVREALHALELDSVARTSGGEGLHVLVPIARRHTHEEARRFAQVVAQAIRRAYPRLGASIDTKMNGHGQQFVAPYSVRPLPGAPVATPLRWDDVRPGLDPGAFSLATVLERVERFGDLHAPLLHGRQRLDRALAPSY